MGWDDLKNIIELNSFFFGLAFLSNKTDVDKILNYAKLYKTFITFLDILKSIENNNSYRTIWIEILGHKLYKRYFDRHFKNCRSIILKQ